MLVEQLAAEGACAREDTRFLACAQPKVFAAIQKVCLAELGGVGFAARLTPFDAERPLYAQMLAAGYSVLGTVPLREVVIGRVGRLLQPFASEPRVRDKRAFAAFDEPGHIKVLLGFQLQSEERAGTKGTAVTAALRMWGVAGGAGWLRSSWPVVSGIGGAVSRAFLVALAERAES